ncbi:MAG TPA: hypothetical protein PKI59_02050 [Candidatus Cloacimonadota bacterium]|nr:hypothetical protein [Candidatus Cloacimonadota bacterium]
MSFLILLSVVLFKLTVYDWNMPAFYIGGMLLVIGNLMPYFIITEYELYETRIQVRYAFFTINRQYSDFGCFYRDKRGIMLSTFKLPRRLDTFRGQSLRFSKTGAELPKLIEILKEKVGKEY